MATWLTLDESISFPTQLMRYFVESIRSVYSGFGEVTNTLLNIQGVGNSALVTSLLNELFSVKDDIYLVIDDFHYITDKQVTGMVYQLLSKAPGNLHMILTTRETPRFPIGRLRELGVVAEIFADELRFSRAEIEIFCQIQKLSLSDQDIDALNINTEGWPAGLQLASISLRNRPNASEFVKSFSGGYRVISDFLAEDVLNGLPAEIQEFLVHTSFLHRLCPEICDCIFDADNSSVLLNQIERANLFLFPLDEERKWYRYHHLFSEFLMTRLMRKEAQTVNAMYKKASEWSRKNNHLLDSIQYAFKLEDCHYGLQLLEEYSEKIFASGKLDVIKKFTERLPESELNEYPRLQLDRMWSYTLNWEFERAKHILNKVKKYLATTKDLLQDIEEIEKKVLHREFMLALFTDQMTHAEELIYQWLDATDESDLYLTASAKSSLLYARREQYDCRNISEQSASIRHLYEKGNADFGTVWHDCIIAPAFVLTGNLSRAADIYMNSIKKAREINGEQSGLVAMPALLLAEVFYVRNELVEVEKLLEEYLPFATEIGFLDQLITGYLCKSRLEYHRGELQSAQKTLDHADEVAAAHCFTRLHANVLNERVRQLTDTGNVESARKILVNSKLFLECKEYGPGPEVTTTQEAVILAWARINRHTEQRDESIKILKKWVKYVDRLGCNRSVIRFSVELALTMQAADEKIMAKRYLRQALSKAVYGPFVRLFVDEGKPMYEMLNTYVTEAGDQVSDPVITFSKNILSAFGIDSGNVKSGVEEDLNESELPFSPLVGRELEILELVEMGVSNQDIASRLGLSFPTVKWYMQKIFEKLKVRRRYAAVNRAKKLGLLP